MIYDYYQYDFRPAYWRHHNSTWEVWGWYNERRWYHSTPVRPGFNRVPNTLLLLAGVELDA